MIVDMVMPKMNGAMAIKIIRDSYPDIKIVAMSSFLDDETIQNPECSLICQIYDGFFLTPKRSAPIYV